VGCVTGRARWRGSSPGPAAPPLHTDSPGVVATKKRLRQLLKRPIQMDMWPRGGAPLPAGCRPQKPPPPRLPRGLPRLAVSASTWLPRSAAHRGAGEGGGPARGGEWGGGAGWGVVSLVSLVSLAHACCGPGSGSVHQSSPAAQQPSSPAAQQPSSPAAQQRSSAAAHPQRGSCPPPSWTRPGWWSAAS
jgi:hypothetical protein